MFALKHVGEDGRELTFHIEHVDPLGFAALRDCLKGGRRSHPTVMRGYVCDESGKHRNETFEQAFPIEFREKVPFYGLVPGGVLPVPFLHMSTLVLDRNVVAALRRLEGSKHSDASGMKWSLGFLDSAAHKLNPMAVAFEGGAQRTPSFEEFCDEVEAFAETIKLRLPSARITKFSAAVLRSLHELRVSFDARAAREVQFLRSVAPFLSHPVATTRLAEIERRVVDAAMASGVRESLVFLVALAKLYESPDGVGGGAAQGVLKLTDPYPEEKAYNALSDLRQMEFAGGSQLLPGTPALLTADLSLALLWCGLRITAQVGATDLRCTWSPLSELFPRRLPQRQLPSLTLEE